MVRGRWRWLLLVVAALALALGGCGGDDNDDGASGGGDEGKTGGTLVFAGASDPVVIDGALVSDGESIRVVTQIFETLIGLKPGSTDLVPALATEWKVSPDAKTYTFTLRDGVKFHDGTEFNADAACFNFNRWYNFKGVLQNPDVSAYWQDTFGGFAKNETADQPPSLFKSCAATNPTTVVLTIANATGRIPAALSLPSFSMQSPEALK